MVYELSQKFTFQIGLAKAFQKVAGMVIAGAGAVLVQIKRFDHKYLNEI